MKTVEVREISYEQAKSEICLYFNDHHGEEISPSDIEMALGIDFEIASAICIELVNEEQIKKRRKRWQRQRRQRKKR